MFKIAFTGHRPQKLNCKTEGIKQALYQFLEQQKEKHGKLIVISGGALGVDQYAAEIARELNIPYVMILPFPVQVMGKMWNNGTREHLKDIINGAVKTYVVQKTFSFEGYQRRNESMVDHCDLLCAVWNGTKGGTKNCIDYAKEVGRKIKTLSFSSSDSITITKKGPRGNGIYIGRPSKYGNPFPTKKSKFNDTIFPLAESLKRYREDIENGTIDLSELVKIYKETGTLTLDCFCIERTISKPCTATTCHGEIIANYILGRPNNR